MGAKDWVLAYCQEDPRPILRSCPSMDREFARVVAGRLYPGRVVTPIADSTIGESSNPDDDLVYVGAYGGLTLVCTSIAAIDRPSQLPRPVVELVPARWVFLHAMHSVVAWFAYAAWADGALRRSLSVAPDSGVIENLGDPWPFEMPYWSGLHPAYDPDEVEAGDEPYPLPFNPLELAETVLDELLGCRFEFEGDAPDPDPLDAPLAGFRVH